MKTLTKLGQQYNFAIIIWGEIDSPFGVEVFQPRLTLASLPDKDKSAVTLALSSVTQDTMRADYQSPPGTVSLPPQRIQEPLKLIRFTMGIMFEQRGNWSEAARHLTNFIENGLSEAVAAPDVYSHAAEAYIQLNWQARKRNNLITAREYLFQALKGYEAQHPTN